MVLVSNPWREAIEELVKILVLKYDEVSNPWREAIEVAIRLCLMQKQRPA